MTGTTAPVFYHSAQDVIFLLIYYHGWWRHFQKTFIWSFITYNLFCRSKTQMFICIRTYPIIYFKHVQFIVFQEYLNKADREIKNWTLLRLN